MNGTIHFGPTVWVPTQSDASTLVDPLDDDSPNDQSLTVTRRGLCRIATVAAEAGARFQRDGTGVDPIAWMLAPRSMFGGAAPIDVCMQRGPFLRGVLVHGLALDLDMGAEEVDDLLDSDGGRLGEVRTDGPLRAPSTGPGAPGQRLFTATIVSNDGFETVHAFHASLAVDKGEIAGRLYCRVGAASADAVILEGFDFSDPMVEALVAPAIADTLLQVARDPSSPLAAGLDLNIEQRFFG